MSCQRGNVSRTRPQTHKNSVAFKNNLYDKTPQIKTINSIHVSNVCQRCKDILEWKIKYKKYKLLKAPGSCVQCNQKKVVDSYHTVCRDCAKKANICGKCGKQPAVVTSDPSLEEEMQKDKDFQREVKILSERRRRTLLRYISKVSKSQGDPDQPIVTKEDVLVKLEALKLNDKSAESDEEDCPVTQEDVEEQ